MKRLCIVTLAMLGLSSFMVISASAQNPHFLSCGAAGVNPDGSLDVSFRIAGLGSNVSITVTASAHADAVYACRNKGQNCPNAANKVNVSTDVSTSGTFTSGKNGSVRGTLSIDPPPTELNCPGGQKLVLVSVSYTPVSVSAPGAGDCSPSPGTFAANFFPDCP